MNAFATTRLKLTGVLFTAAVCLLVVTGLVKIVSALQDTNLLSDVDPVLGWSRRTTMLAGGLFELLIAVLAVSDNDPICRMSLLASAVVAFSTYRIAFQLMGASEPCSCLGSLAEWSPFLRSIEKEISSSMFWVLAVIVAAYSYTMSRSQVFASE